MVTKISITVVISLMEEFSLTAEQDLTQAVWYSNLLATNMSTSEESKAKAMFITIEPIRKRLLLHIQCLTVRKLEMWYLWA